ncbi:MAG TPA: DEAD/DEAH box helicase, partial [Tepidisphaeraceae bacterium]
MSKESPKTTTETETPASDGFGGLGLDKRLVQTLSVLGYEEPTPIQRESIPPLLAGKDMIGQAATGTGKTAAFALPLLQRILERGEKRAMPSAIVLVPTRELAMQVSEAIHKYGRSLGTSVLPVFGGQSFETQVRGLKRGVDLIVATPGRALDHIRRGTLKLDTISEVVLDEADEMLDMGFAEEIESMLAEMPKTRQTVLFSATLPPRIAAIAKR